MTKTRFADLKTGDKFTANGKRFVKTDPVYAPQRGYLISNARSEAGTAARFGGAAMVEPC